MWLSATRKRDRRREPEWGLPEDAFPLLLSIRRLVPRMGLENLVAAFPNVRAVFPKAKLVIGGRGPLIESLEAQVRTLGISDAVTFAGFIAEEEVVDYYRGADLFVLPTLSLEGFWTGDGRVARVRNAGGRELLSVRFPKYWAILEIAVID